MGFLLALGIALYCTGQTKTKTLVFLFISLIVLAGISAIRYEVGDDYYNYMHIFIEVSDLSQSQHRYEPGFILLIKIVQLFTNHFQWFYAVVAFLTTALVMLLIFRESQLPFLSVVLYMTMLFYYWSLSLIRQLLAAVICSLGVRYIKKRRFLPYLMLVLIATSIHNSALIMLPFYLLAQIPFNYKTFLAVFAISLVGFIFAPSILEIVTQYVYQGYSPDSPFGQGSSLIYGVFPFIAFLVVWSFKGRLLRKSRDNNVAINFMMYAAIISLFIARVYIVERLSIYFFLYAIVLIPNMLCTLLPSEKELSDYRIEREKLRLLKGTQKNVVRNKLKEQSTRVKDARILFGFAVGCTVFITLLYHLFALSQDFYHIKDYQTIFNKHPTERFAASRDLYSEYLIEIGYPT